MSLTGSGFLIDGSVPSVLPNIPVVEHMSVEGEVDFGVYRLPQEFLGKVLDAQHPCHFDNLLPEDLRQAIKTNVEMSEEALAKMWTERLRERIAWAQELQVHEDLFKQELPMHQKLVLSKKAPVSFQECLAAGWPWGPQLS